MSLLCSTNCGAPASLVNYFDLCNLIKRQSGGSCMAHIKCDYQFTDITDAAEWTQAITDGNVFVTPLGKWELPEPTPNILTEATGCGEDEIESYTYLVPFSTPYAEVDGSDFAFYKSWLNNFKQYRSVLVGCDGQIYMSDDYFEALTTMPAVVTLAGVSPGYEYSFSKPPYEDRTGTAKRNVSWNVELKIENSGLLCAYSLPDVATVLCG